MRLCYVPEGSFREAGAKELWLLMHGQEHNLRRRSSVAKLMSGLNTIEYGHHYVHHDYVRLEPGRIRDQISAIIRRSNDLVIMQEQTHAFEYRTVVVSNKNGWSRQGSSLRTSKNISALDYALRCFPELGLLAAYTTGKTASTPALG